MNETVTTITEELVLVEASDYNECASTLFFVTSIPSLSPPLAPVFLDKIKARAQTLVNKCRSQTAVLTIVKFNDPEVWLG